MEFVIRPIEHAINSYDGSRFIRSEVPVLEADAVSLTANPSAGSPMEMSCHLYRWNRELIHRAAVRVNRFRRVGALLGMSPKLFLVPRTTGENSVADLIQGLLDAVEEERVEVLHFSHYRTINAVFPTAEIESVLRALRDRMSQTSLRVLIWDIDSRYRPQLMELKRKWLAPARSGALGVA